MTWDFLRWEASLQPELVRSVGVIALRSACSAAFHSTVVSLRQDVLTRVGLQMGAAAVRPGRGARVRRRARRLCAAGRRGRERARRAGAA